MTSSQCLIDKLKAVRGKFGFRASFYTIPINFVNDSCLFLSVTFAMVHCFLAGVTVEQTLLFFVASFPFFKATNDLYLL